MQANELKQLIQKQSYKQIIHLQIIYILYIYIYIYIYIYKQDLALNKPQGFICHKIPTNQPKTNFESILLDRGGGLCDSSQPGLYALLWHAGFLCSPLNCQLFSISVNEKAPSVISFPSVFSLCATATVRAE